MRTGMQSRALALRGWQYWAALGLLLSGCTGQVNLGSSKVTFGGPDPAAVQSGNLAPGTTSILGMNYMFLGDLGVDERYLYLNACSIDNTNCKIVRCDKTNCLSTLTPIHELNVLYGSARGFWQDAGWLGWVDPNTGFEICHMIAWTCRAFPE